MVFPVICGAVMSGRSERCTCWCRRRVPCEAFFLAGRAGARAESCCKAGGPGAACSTEASAVDHADAAATNKMINRRENMDHSKSTTRRRQRDENIPTAPNIPNDPFSSHFPEDGVFLVEVGGLVEREEELAVIGARLVLVRHRHLPAVVELDAGVDLVSERLAVDALAPVARACRVPALDHELPDNSVENRVVVVLFRGGGSRHRGGGKKSEGQRRRRDDNGSIYSEGDG